MLNQFYYEFSDNEYYGLVAVSTDEYDLKTQPYIKATEIYLKGIGGDSVNQILDEGTPYQRTKEYAFMKFAYAPNTLNHTAEELIKEFENIKDGVLLVDGSLI